MKKIAYITQVFPLLTETAVYREVLKLREMGFTIVPLSVHWPYVNQLSEDSKHLVAETTYVYRAKWYEILTAHLYFLLTYPDRYISTLLYVLTPPDQTPRNRWRTLWHFGGAIYLAAKIRQHGVQHLHAHFSINAATMALVIARMLDISFSFTAHNICFIEQVILPQKLVSARFIACISQYTRDFLFKYLPANRPELKEKFHIVHCGIPVDTFQPVNPISSVNPVILSFGQLAERKGMPFLVEACRVLQERGCAFECIIIGDGPQRPLLEQMINDYHLQDKVKLTGSVFQEKILEYLGHTDISVLPCIVAEDGDRDGVPATLMEAMAMEIPCVSTYVSGIPELIDHEKSGLLVPEKDAVAMADALQRLLEDKELRLKLGKAGRQKVLAEFNLNKSVAQLAELFKQYV